MYEKPFVYEYYTLLIYFSNIYVCVEFKCICELMFIVGINK